nr:MFS transporter [Streptomyces sp. CC228A]
MLWFLLLANSGGDLAAQDAWARFAADHPGSAYNLSWYGGMHTASYSLLSPYVMAVLGVRTTMMLAGTVSAGLVALLLVRARAVRNVPACSFAAVSALLGNALSGRVTFGLGLAFALGAVAVLVCRLDPEAPAAAPVRRRGRHLLAVGALGGLATAASPVAGLFLGFVAAALFLRGRFAPSLAAGLPAVAVVALSAWLFPFAGTQPMGLGTVVLPFACAVLAFGLVPAQWRTVRAVAAVYALATLLTWLADSQIGSNVTRLAMLFGGVVLLAALPHARRDAPGPPDAGAGGGEGADAPGTRREGAGSSPPRAGASRTGGDAHRRGATGTAAGPRGGRGRRWYALALALVVFHAWVGFKSVDDVVRTTPKGSWAHDPAPLVAELTDRGANLARVEVVPARSHRESSALAPYVTLARGWNRQADLERNPLFYDGSLTAATYRAWLHRWAVRYVVLPTGGTPDMGAREEAALVAGGLPYLEEVWSDTDWRLFAVRDATPLADPPATVEHAGAGGMLLRVDEPGRVLIRVAHSPWLALVDGAGRRLSADDGRGCLRGAPETADGDRWTELVAPQAGLYRLEAPYGLLSRGTPC